MADWIGEAAKYFGKRKAGRSPLNEKMDEAIGAGSIPLVPNTGGIPPTPPPIPQKRLQDRSTKGSPPFSGAELKQGYRKMGKGIER